ncbi:arginine N-methyltransferase 9-like 1 [Homarus americanus]|uniref:Arginine N-methyltransferase 9-like 1 n=1 Tax=Homarus americanus TaxID=6706 RepID=A0A8J5MYX2_HOMAM|nr:arginine N-methyltransferase 9-like 1 [Homarus americanus]
MFSAPKGPLPNGLAPRFAVLTAVPNRQRPNGCSKTYQTRPASLTSVEQRRQHGSVREAWNYACLAQVECPRDPNVQETRSRLTNALVDRWHLPMLNDSTRNGAFKLAIERAMECGHQTVLDIGSGTGLLR